MHPVNRRGRTGTATVTSFLTPPCHMVEVVQGDPPICHTDGRLFLLVSFCQIHCPMLHSLIALYYIHPLPHVTFVHGPMLHLPIILYYIHHPMLRSPISPCYIHPCYHVTFIYCPMLHSPIVPYYIHCLMLHLPIAPC